MNRFIREDTKISKCLQYFVDKFLRMNKIATAIGLVDLTVLTIIYFLGPPNIHETFQVALRTLRVITYHRYSYFQKYVFQKICNITLNVLKSYLLICTNIPTQDDILKHDCVCVSYITSLLDNIKYLS